MPFFYDYCEFQSMAIDWHLYTPLKRSAIVISGGFCASGHFCPLRKSPNVHLYKPGCYILTWYVINLVLNLFKPFLYILSWINHVWVLIIIDSCIIWFHLDCIMQLKQSTYIATNVCSIKSAATFGDSLTDYIDHCNGNDRISNFDTSMCFIAIFVLKTPSGAKRPQHEDLRNFLTISFDRCYWKQCGSCA